MKLTKYGPRTMESGSSGDHYTVMDVRPDGEWLKAADVEAKLETIIKQIEDRAADAYCESLRLSDRHCRGLQVLHTFPIEQQQDKLNHLKESEQLMGKHIAYATVCKLLNALRGGT